MLLGGCGRPGRGMLEVRERTLVGDELRLLVESSVRLRPLLSHSSTVSDVKCWLVAIDLGSALPLAERSRVWGPIYDVADPRSFVSYQAGANFTDADAAAAAATPECRFDVDGNLLRFARDGARATYVRDRLETGPQGATWRRLGDVTPVVDGLPPMSEDRLLTSSGRWLLLRQGPLVQLFDLDTGERVDDAWLTGCFGRARSIRRFENVCYSLTEQLDHLVVSPQPEWNDGSRDGVETFEFEGQTLQRRDWGIVFHRPDPTGHLFRRKPAATDGDTWDSPREGYSFGGELRLFSTDGRILRLWRPEGGEDVVMDIGEELEQRLFITSAYLHRAGSRTIHLFHDDPYGVKPGMAGVVSWDCAANAITHREAQLSDLFEVRDGEQRPKRLQPVR